MITKTQPKFELLKEAYAIIGGIPAKAINLDAILSEKGESLSCGTIACGIGWLSLHPKFQAYGLKIVDRELYYKGNHSYYEAAAMGIFNIEFEDAEHIFASTYDCHNPLEDGMSPKLSHKQRWMYRVRAFLRKHGQLKSQLKAKSS